MGFRPEEDGTGGIQAQTDIFSSRVSIDGRNA